MRVAVLGASPKRERYSNIAIRELLKAGHEVVPINPGHSEVEGMKCYPRLQDVTEPIHTVSVYVGPHHIAPMISDIEAVKPSRVIINPGAESSELTSRMKKSGIRAVQACTLVMLRSGEF